MGQLRSECDASFDGTANAYIHAPKRPWEGDFRGPAPVWCHSEEMNSPRKLPALVVLCGVGLALACGSTEDNLFPDAGSSSSGEASSSGFGSSGFGSSGTSGGNADAASCSTTLEATGKPKVDILFVIDNSGSMTEEMVQIRTNVNAFAAKIGTSGLDYGVVFVVRRATSAAQTGNVICVPPPLGGATCADNAPLFHHIDQNVGSLNSIDLLQKNYATGFNWSQYLRPDATKVFIEVSDDNSSVKAAAFDTFLLSKGTMFGTAAKRGYIFHSIVGWQPATALTDPSQCSTAAGNGMVYRELSTLTGGIVDSVCKTDYSGVLDNIAKGIVDKLACELGVPAAASADPSKVLVQSTKMSEAPKLLTQVTGADKCDAVPDAWYYDNNTTPTKIILCKTTCASTAGTKVEALVGCKAPPPR
jgi:hypothetical protein